MVRILQWGMVPGLCGGVETFVMNVYRNIDRKQIQFDFLLYEGSEKLYFEDEIQSLGGHIYREYKRIKKYPIAHFKQLDRFFEKHPDIKGVHYNATALFDIDVIRAAQRHDLPVRIIHSHNTGYDRENTSWYLNFIDEINRKNLKRFVTHRFACSEEAGKWMFRGDDFKVIRNGIDIRNISYDRKERIRLRREFHVEDRIVCVLVGRLERQKNPIFALELIKKVKSKFPQIYCLFVGEGALRDEMEIYISENRLETNVRILGNRRDVSAILSAADIFLFPSLYEGLSIAALEAQASGLPCIISDTVPQSVINSDIVFIAKLNDIIDWEGALVNSIRGLEKEYLEDRREGSYKSIKNAGYDILDTAAELQREYLKSIQRSNE